MISFIVLLIVTCVAILFLIAASFEDREPSLLLLAAFLCVLMYNSGKTIIELEEKVKTQVNQEVTLGVPVITENTSVSQADMALPSDTEVHEKFQYDLALYEETLKAVKGCRRAEVRLLELTETQGGITQENYQEIMSSVMRCKAFELEKQLNNKG